MPKPAFLVAGLALLLTAPAAVAEVTDLWTHVDSDRQRLEIYGHLVDGWGTDLRASACRCHGNECETPCELHPDGAFHCTLEPLPPACARLSDGTAVPLGSDDPPSATRPPG